LATTGNFLAAELMGLVSRLHRSTPIDIIHAHAALPCGHAAALIGEKLAIPFVVSVHGLDVFFEEQVGAPWANWCKKACTQVYARASRVICISEKVRSRLPADAARKSAVVYNGVDPEMFSPAAESVSPLTVLSVGNLIAIKDHALLVRAFARSCRDNPNCQLQIIGEGRERGNLVGLTKSLGIHNRTQFLGRQPREAVAEAMKHCAIFALPSRYEGLGCVYLEAMATAKPVLGCRGQGIEDIIEHGKNGLLIHPGDEAEFADALVTLLRSPELRRQLGGNARKTIVQNLTLEHQAQHLMQICRECAA
jgi:glycosyltransferase involved in cell wall biosynthesis